MSSCSLGRRQDERLARAEGPGWPHSPHPSPPASSGISCPYLWAFAPAAPRPQGSCDGLLLVTEESALRSQPPTGLDRHLTCTVLKLCLCLSPLALWAGFCCDPVLQGRTPLVRGRTNPEPRRCPCRLPKACLSETEPAGRTSEGVGGAPIPPCQGGEHSPSSM